MGKLKQGILGGISGSVGNVTGSSWKGIPVIKSKPLSVANPKTADQQAQRGKFSNVVALAKPILADIIKPLNDRFAVQKSGFNAFISRNVSLFVNAEPVPQSEFEMSGGNMSSTQVTIDSLDETNDEVTVSWPDDSGEGMKLSDDDAYLVVINGNTKNVDWKGAAAQRDAGTVTISVQSVTSGTTYTAYLAFRRKDGTVASKTSYYTKSVVV